jgi:hypothetical protein
VVDVWIELDLDWNLGFVHCLLMAGGYGLYLVFGSWLDFEVDIGWILGWTSSHGYFKDFSSLRFRLSINEFSYPPHLTSSFFTSFMS